jgi:hypothetical protein
MISRRKPAAFILICSLVHFGLMFYIIVGRLDCGMQAYCVSKANEIAGNVLSFPLGPLSLLLQHMGVDVDRLMEHYAVGGPFPVFFLNSVLASTIFWFAIVKPWLKRRRSQPANR